jgi:hypothetical protein
MGQAPVTQLLDRYSDVSTLASSPRPTPSTIRVAEDFYLHGPPPTNRVSIQVVVPDPTGRLHWLATQVEDQLNDLLRLRTGWDGRRGQPPTPAAVDSAIDVFATVGADAFPPQLFPLSDGGLQLEWHAGASVEIEVDASGAVHVLAADENDQIVINDEMGPGDTQMLDRVRASLSDLTARLARAR